MRTMMIATLLVALLVTAGCRQSATDEEKAALGQKNQQSQQEREALTIFYLQPTGLSADLHSPASDSKFALGVFTVKPQVDIGTPRGVDIPSPTRVDTPSPSRVDTPSPSRVDIQSPGISRASGGLSPSRLDDSPSASASPRIGEGSSPRSALDSMANADSIRSASISSAVLSKRQNFADVDELASVATSNQLVVKQVTSLDELPFPAAGRKEIVAISNDDPSFAKFGDSPTFTLNNVTYTKKLVDGEYSFFTAQGVVLRKDLRPIEADIDAGKLIKPSDVAAASKINSDAFEAFYTKGIDIVPGAKGTLSLNGQTYSYEISDLASGKGSGGKIFNVKLIGESNASLQSEFVVKTLPKPQVDLADEIPELAALEVKLIEGRYQEIKVLDAMSPHPNSLTFHGAYAKDETYLVGMEKASGGDMLRVLEDVQAGKAVPEKELNSLILSSAESLSSMHSVNRYHGDVKSDNFFIGKPGEAKIADFGESNGGSKAEDMKRYAAMVYQLKTGKKTTPEALQGTLEAQAQHTPFDDLLLDIMKKNGDEAFTMRTVTNRLMQVL